jgi:type IV secretion/conjugal transfer VirB4 family ATPase
MISFAVFILLACAGVLACIVIAWAARGTRAEEGRRWVSGLPDLLLYASMIDDGILLLQDGALMATWRYAGPDLGSVTHEEMAALAERLNSVLKLGSGWLVHCDAIRSEVSEYARQGAFPDPVTSLIDDERRAQFKAEGRHFESTYYISLTYLPPMRSEEKVKGYLFKGGEEESKTAGETALIYFKDRLGLFHDVLSSQVRVERLCGHSVVGEDGAETAWISCDLARYVRRCVTGEDYPFILPAIPVFLHDLIGCASFKTGVEPMVGNKHIQIVAIDGFPATSFPGILAALDTLPFEYRWNTRAVLLDPEEAKKIITDALKKWTAKARGFIDQLMGRPPKRIDPFALKMMEDATVAIGEASSGDVQFVLYSGNIILMDEDNEGVKDRARQVAKIIKNLGFGARLESFNAVEAWRGTLPGDGYRNVRRIILHTLNLADCMPIAAIWTGDRVSSSALMPKNSEPLMYATSTGSTVFRFNLHVGDLAHTLVVGPPGAGKSTLLCGIEAQFFRYPNAQVFVFDKGYSAWALNQAAGGEFYNLGSEDGGMSFAPFAEIDTSGDIAWAAQYIEQLCALAGHTVVPAERKEILKALQLLVQSKTRTFTELLVNLQNLPLRDALRVYTLEGSLGGLLEAKANQSVLGHGRFMVFEMEHLMGMGERAVVSVLLFLFHQIEKRLDGSPTAIVLDEAWVFLKHELFKEFIRDWAKTLRKANAALMLSTQNWSDIFNSSLKDVLIETCPNKIFLPNPEATSETVRVYYEMLGVNAREVEMISRAIPKREYYQRTPNGRRLFNIGFGPVALAFVGVSGPEVRARIGEIRKTHGEGWISEWLRVRGVPNWADYFETKYGAKQSGPKLVS